ncbi:MAG: flagellar hook-associated protein FlgK [Woeseiaceae bacterium]|nr:flagellar hook-associated protein FlgK [Woeseiaceae bacterium]
MPDLLKTSLSGMLAFQRALDLTGHNIANANTPGYSRQVPEFTARIGGGAGQTYIGGGTQIRSIERMYDALLVEQLRTSNTGLNRFNILNALAGQVDSLLADPDTGLNTGMQGFFNSLQDVGNDPANLPVRQAMLGEADGLVSRFHSLDARLESLESEVNDRVRLAVDDINRVAAEIGEVNDRIALAGAGAKPNDLLDRRDQLLLELSGLVSVSTSQLDDGSVNVFVGSGQALVLGAEAQALDVRPSEFEPTRLRVVYRGAGGDTPIDNSLSGGTLGGLLEFRSRMLDTSRQSLGQTAVAFVQQFNAQHAAGMDLRGNLGGDFFAIDPPGVLYSSGNSGSGTATATVSDLGAFTGADYILEFDGASYGLTRADTGASIPLTGSGTAADPFVADGISIEVGGAAAAGDRVMIRTGHGAASSIQTLISDPRSIALSAPTRVQAALGNIGDASVNSVSAADPADPNLLTTAVIEFTGANTYQVNGAGSFTYTDGQPIVINGTSVTITGNPGTGDQFTIEPNAAAGGDNGNALLLADIQAAGVLDGGAISIGESYGQLVASVGSSTYQIQASLDAQSVIHSNAQNEVLSKSAVNLDEEAANLIRFQQAYQAAAQVVNVTKTLFDTLLAATSR